MGYPCGREWVVIGRRAKKGLWDAGNILLVDRSRDRGAYKGGVEAVAPPSAGAGSGGRLVWWIQLS